MFSVCNVSETATRGTGNLNRWELRYSTCDSLATSVCCDMMNLGTRHSCPCTLMGMQFSGAIFLSSFSFWRSKEPLFQLRQVEHVSLPASVPRSQPGQSLCQTRSSARGTVVGGVPVARAAVTGTGLSPSSAIPVRHTHAASKYPAVSTTERGTE